MKIDVVYRCLKNEGYVEPDLFTLNEDEVLMETKGMEVFLLP
jgi:hypothetical protein